MLLPGDLGDKRAFDPWAALPGLARAWFWMRNQMLLLR